MLKLIGGRRNRGFRVMWALEELGLPYMLEEARPQSPEVFAVNPLGQVPVLLDGDAVVTDSLAILHYLADRNGALTYPAETVERAMLDARINFVLTEMEAPLWLMARHGFVLPEDQRIPGMRAVAEADFARAAARLELLLGDAEFIAGEGFTIADIVAGHTANWARNAKVPVDGALLAYLDRMTARDGFRRAMGEA